MDIDTIYYAHFPCAIFDISRFQRWDWKLYNSGRNLENHQCQCPEVEQRNLKIFLHPHYDVKKLSVIIKILERAGFQCVAKQRYFDHIRVIFGYGISYYVRKLCFELANVAVMESETKKRKAMKPTVYPNHYPEAGYFVRKVHCKDAKSEKTWDDEWVYPCKHYKDAVYWRRYFRKHRDENVKVHRASYIFEENEVELGGRWMNENNGKPMEGIFYPAPDELIEADPTGLTMTEYVDQFSMIPERETRMVRWYSQMEKKCTGRTWVSLPTCILSCGEELLSLLDAHVVKSHGPYVGKLTIEKQDVRDETTVYYRIV